jgi:phage FluMu protein Com
MIFFNLQCPNCYFQLTINPNAGESICLDCGGDGQFSNKVCSHCNSANIKSLLDFYYQDDVCPKCKTPNSFEPEGASSEPFPL